MIKTTPVWTAAATILAILVSTRGSAQVFERININSSGVQSATAGTVPQSTRVVSADGRFVVFSSAAGDLVADDTNGVSDVFLRDRTLGTTVRVSVNKDDGGDASAESHSPSISSNGRFIAFASLAGDLVSGDGNGSLDVFIYDRVLDQMTRASVPASSGETDGDSKDPFINGDGRFVTFSSSATNLVAEGANINVDIYVRDLYLGETIKVSERPGGILTELNSWNPAISADGRHVVFTSGDDELVPGDTVGNQDVFVRNLDTWAIERISVSTAGGESNARNGVAAISSDGSAVAWWSRADNLVDADDNAQDDIFVRDRVAGTTTRVNVSSAGEQAIGGGSWFVSITDDGCFVLFLSDAGNLVDDDVNGFGDIFSHDRRTGITRRHSLNPGGAGGNNFSTYPSVTPDGVYVAFESTAYDFVTGDDNQVGDIFLAWGPAMVMEDGFESADCSRWSAEVGVCDPDGIYASTPSITYTCALGTVALDINQFTFTNHGAQISAGSSLPNVLVGMPSYCGSGDFSSSVTLAGACTEAYTLEGSFTSADSWTGSFSATYTGTTCGDCTNQVFQVSGTRQ